MAKYLYGLSKSHNETKESVDPAYFILIFYVYDKVLRTKELDTLNRSRMTKQFNICFIFTETLSLLITLIDSKILYNNNYTHK